MWCHRYSAVHAAVYALHPVRSESDVHHDRGDAAAVLALVASPAGAGRGSRAASSRARRSTGGPEPGAWGRPSQGLRARRPTALAGHAAPAPADSSADHHLRDFSLNASVMNGFTTKYNEKGKRVYI